jgi:hypothetical protein
MATYFAQKLGAGMVNVLSATANTVDLRPLVGLQTEQATALLRGYKITDNALTTIDVAGIPSWTDAAFQAGKSSAPAAFPITDSLTMYKRGDVVVGFDVTSPFTALQKQVDDLSEQVAAMQRPSNNVPVNQVPPVTQ